MGRTWGKRENKNEARLDRWIGPVDSVGLTEAKARRKRKRKKKAEHTHPRAGGPCPPARPIFGWKTRKLASVSGLKSRSSLINIAHRKGVNSSPPVSSDALAHDAQEMGGRRRTAKARAPLAGGGRSCSRPERQGGHAIGVERWVDSDCIGSQVRGDLCLTPQISRGFISVLTSPRPPFVGGKETQTSRAVGSILFLSPLGGYCPLLVPPGAVAPFCLTSDLTTPNAPVACVLSVNDPLPHRLSVCHASMVV